MKRFIILILTILAAMQISAQIYIDLKQLKEMGIDINTYPPEQLLELGIGNCDLEIIKSAVAKGVDLNKQLEGAGVSVFPLCRAISAALDAILPGEGGFIASQIRDYGAAVFSGRSAPVIRQDYIEIIRFLLQKGARATVDPDFSSDNIPLLLAAHNRDIEIVKLLLDFKADPNSRDMMGNTALHELGLVVALPLPYRNAPEIARLLISKGARISKNDDGEGGPNGKTPMTLTKSQLDIVQSSEASYWRDLPFYNEVVSSLKSLIEIYSKM